MVADDFERAAEEGIEEQKDVIIDNIIDKIANHIDMMSDKENMTEMLDEEFLHMDNLHGMQR